MNEELLTKGGDKLSPPFDKAIKEPRKRGTFGSSFSLCKDRKHSKKEKLFFVYSFLQKKYFTKQPLQTIIYKSKIILLWLLFPWLFGGGGGERNLRGGKDG